MTKIKTEPREYAIYRHFHPSLDKKPQLRIVGLTLTEAQEHCSNPKTKKGQEWFDGYQKMR